jgi:hypothetical protein
MLADNVSEGRRVARACAGQPVIGGILRHERGDRSVEGLQHVLLTYTLEADDRVQGVRGRASAGPDVEEV